MAAGKRSAKRRDSIAQRGGSPGGRVRFAISVCPADPQGEEHENAYKSAIEKIPQKPKSADPWQGVRSGSGTQNKTTR